LRHDPAGSLLFESLDDPSLQTPIWRMELPTWCPGTCRAVLGRRWRGRLPLSWWVWI